MTGKELAEKAVDLAKNYKTVYMWGVFGAPVTESVISAKSKQYPSWYTKAKQAELRKLIGKGYFAFDCVCLIKAILWGWNGDKSKAYGGAKYASNGVPDISANVLINRCTSVSAGGWNNLKVGECLWCTGHVGIYIGNGLAVECTPAWANDVQITAVTNIGAKAGYNSRKWTKHGKIPWISYAEPIQKGDTVKVTKAKTYTGAAFRVYYKEYTVMELKGDRAVIGVNGIITAAVNVANLEKV